MSPRYTRPIYSTRQPLTSSFFQPKRYLKLFSQPREEVLIANHSGLHLAYAAQHLHGKSAHPKLKIIIPDFWLSKVHSDYDDLEWGQTLKGVPWYVRCAFREMDATYDENQLLKWKQVKKLREHVIGQLKKNGAQVYTGKPTIAKTNGGYQITTHEATLKVPHDTYFYNAFREPELNLHLNHRLPRVHNTVLYQSPRAEVPKTIVLLGGGRSAIWLAQHFPDTLFACIKYSHRPFPLFEKEEMPINLLPYPKEEFGKTYQLFYDTKKNKVAIYSDNREEDFYGDFYYATGLKHCPDVMQAVDVNNVLPFPSQELSWLGPRQETPPGSLIEAGLRWAEVTENSKWSAEYFCFHSDFFVDYFTKELQARQISVENKFFELLKEKTKNQEYAPSFEQMIRLYEACYQAIHPRNAQHLEALFNEKIKERLKYFKP